ncbi:MAG: hypothetical protein GY810_04545, partial [Aureispira sp.]|nr:hypothetical protein [Aureispira sp.]
FHINNGAEGMRLASNGHVGIGGGATVVAPAEKLGVAPDTDVSAEIGRAHVGAMGHGDWAGFSHVDVNGTGSYALLQGATGETRLNAPTGQNTLFTINNVESMRLASNGNVGIGTIAPTHELHVNNLARLGVAEIGTSPAFANYALFGHNTLDHTNGGNYALLQGSSGETHLNAATGQSVSLKINNAEFMRLASNGNVGIGTTTPTHLLHVDGLARFGVVETGTSPAFANYALFGHNTLDHTNGGNYALLQGPGGDTYLNARTGQFIGFRINNAESMRLAANGNLGIGTVAPTHKLHVESLARLGAVETGTWPVHSAFALFGNQALDHSNGGNYALLQQNSGATYLNASTGQSVYFRINNNDRMILNNAGNVGIGTTAPDASLSVNGTASKPGGGTWAVFSDARLKDNVSDYKEGLDLIKQVRTVNFTYGEGLEKIWGESDEIKGTVFQGVIAQELQEIAPDMVTAVNINGEEVLRVDPNKFTYALINAVQEQQAEIDALKAKNSKLEETVNEVSQLKAELNEIKALLQTKLQTNASK